MNPDTINDFIEAQLEVWDDARKRYHNLGKTERKRFKTGDLDGCFQFNPSRIVSTGAKVDSKSLSERPCFLCKENRPECQVPLPVVEGWDFLLNPFPIFPVHFTIASRQHLPQESLPPEALLFADKFPELAVFFNGAKAGASAPDHAHLQAVLKAELPLLRLVEENHPAEEAGIKSSVEFEKKPPFLVFSAVIPPTEEGETIFRKMSAVTGRSDENSQPDPGLRNIVIWKDSGTGVMRMIVIPRKAHRPACYFKEGADRLLVSPGTIDMCGVVVVPREEDFDRLDAEAIEKIYSEVAFSY